MGLGWTCAFAILTAFAPNNVDFNHLVVDQAGLLSSATAQSLESQLRALYRQAGVQLAVVIVPTIEQTPIEEYSLQWAEAWRLGKTKQDTGALLLIALKQRRARIEVGYGLEGVLTDAQSHQILQKVLAPHFGRRDYDGGVVATVAAIVKLVAPGITLQPMVVATNPSSEIPWELLAIVIVMVFVLPFWLGSRGHNADMLMPWLQLMLLGSRGWQGRGGFDDDSGRGGGGGFGGGGSSGGW